MAGAIDPEAAIFSAKLDQMLAQIAIFNADSDPATTFFAKLDLILAQATIINTQIVIINTRLNDHDVRLHVWRQISTSRLQFRVVMVCWLQCHRS